MNRKIQFKNGDALGGVPKICIPLTGKNINELRQEIEEAQGADLLEWRIDAFCEDSMAALPQVKVAAGTLPLLLTIRTRQEGGAGDALGYEERVRALIESGLADLIDIELSQGEGLVGALTALAREKKVLSVVSAHFFHHTPKKEELLSLFQKMEDLGADLPKIAVMPGDFSDVLTLLESAWETAQKNSPLIAISMGKLGRVSRICGEEMGSCITFAAGKNASAPGQISAKILGDFNGDRC